MTEQEIRDKAPSGATHYDKHGNYFKSKGVHWFRLHTSELGFYWNACIFKPDEIKPL